MAVRVYGFMNFMVTEFKPIEMKMGVLEVALKQQC
jgi:hypothetical protein